MEEETAVADWSALPEDIIITVMGCLSVLGDLVRSGAVCSTWRDAYATFRRLHLPSTTAQPPWLLYACDAHGPAAAALYCPATGNSLRVPLPAALLDGRPVIGASQGWLVTVDEVPNLHLVNPLTGATAALPPITSLHNVERFTSRKGKTRYRVYDDMGYSEASIVYSPAKARERVVLSRSPAEGSACVALLLHRPDGDVSFARLGDERWTPVAYPGQDCSTGCRHAIYDDADGLFYTLHYDGSVYAIDVPRAASASSPPPPPATREVMRCVTDLDNGSKYLVRAPCSEDLLQVWRFDYADGDDVEDDEAGLFTRQLQFFKVDGGEQKLVEASAASLEDHVLLLGYEFSACFPAEHFPALKPGCAYLADDHELVSMRKHCRRDIGRWDMKRGQMERLSGEDDVVAPSQPWLNWPTPR
uniref:KIB1-4 beta-propeller domain-containing protein n=1 Tax=Oryza glumipatula TaxID=40148 RepID=A0A0E0AR88_9ORYZ